MNKLTAYWITFPDEDQHFPIGVTAFSIDDAFQLLDHFQFTVHRTAKKVEIKEGVSYDELEELHVRTNMGSIVVRGIWYPFLNH